jgi:hypothetical protein
MFGTEGFAICLCVSPDIDGMFVSRYRYVCSLPVVRTWTGTGHPKWIINPERPTKDLRPKYDTVCFTICLFISPDLDGHDMFHDMFVTKILGTLDGMFTVPVCLFISPDLDGYRASLTL